MGWLLALGILVLAVVSRGFRMVLLVLVLAAGVIGGLWYLVSQQTEQTARRRIQPSEVVLEDATLGRSSYGSSYQLRSRVRNRSRTHAIRTFDLVVTVRDCQGSDETSCDVVGEEDESIFVQVPPGQVRDIDSSIYLSPTPVIRGRLSWSFRITSVRAE